MAAGNHMPPSEVVKLIQDFHINVLTGDGSQVIQVVHHISTLPSPEKRKVKLNKIIYTSEGLSASQRAHISTVLGPIRICSILGSAEAGPYGASNPDITPCVATASHADFIIDSRMTLIEILPLSLSEVDSTAEAVPEGQKGVIAQTSLTRLRNPLVRYLTGDIGSLHPLPETGKTLIPESQWPYLRILRLHGRDGRFSFEWDGAYYDFSKLSSWIASTGCGILQWQVILDKMQPSNESLLEIRLLCSQQNPLELASAANHLRDFFPLDVSNRHRFKVTFVAGLAEFELSETGRKVIKFVDRFH